MFPKRLAWLDLSTFYFPRVNHCWVLWTLTNKSLLGMPFVFQNNFNIFFRHKQQQIRKCVKDKKIHKERKRGLLELSWTLKVDTQMLVDSRSQYIFFRHSYISLPSFLLLWRKDVKTPKRCIQQANSVPSIYLLVKIHNSWVNKVFHNQTSDKGQNCPVNLIHILYLSIWIDSKLVCVRSS